MNKRKLLLILACGCILTACNAEVTDGEGGSAQVETAANITETGIVESETATPENSESEFVASSEASTEESESEASTSEEKQEVYRTIVKSYKTVDGQKVSDVVTDITEQTMDGEGNVVLEEIYGGKNSNDLKKRTAYTYDERGNVLSSEECWYEATGMRTRIWEYEYDDKNQQIEAVLVATTTGQTDTTYRYSYDQDGNLVETQRLQEQEICEIIKYTYDEAGNILRESSNIPSKGDTWEDITYQYVYDEAGNILKMEEFQYGELYYTLICTYDAAGNMLTKGEGGIDVVGPGLWSYEYDEQGNCTKECYLFAENDPGWTDSRQYDSEGRLLNSVTQYNDGTEVVEEYSYEIIEK